MHDLPVEVRQGVLADPVFAKVLADPPGAIRMGTICFDQDRYFEAVETAFKQGTASCVSTTELTFDLRYIAWVGARVPGIILALPGGPEVFQDFNSLYFLLLDNYDETRVAEILESCEMDPDTRADLFDQLRGCSPVERIIRLRATVEQSSLSFFSKLTARIRATGDVNPDGLMPAPSTMLTYLGYSDASIAPSDAACRLIETTSLRTAILRWSAIPAPLPKSLMDAYRGLDRASQRRLAKNLVRNCPNAVALANLSSLLIEATIPCARKAVGSRIVSVLAKAKTSGLGLITDTARWAANELSRNPDVIEWPQSTYLSVAWGCASELLRVFASTSVDPNWIQSYLEPNTALEEFLYAFSRRMDAAHPANVVGESLLLALVYDVASQGCGMRPAVMQSILDLLVTKDEDGALFRPELFFQSQRLENHLSSALGLPREKQLLEVFGQRAADGFAIQSDNSNLQSELRGDVLPDNAMLHYLGLIFGEAPVEETWFRKTLLDWCSLLCEAVETGYANFAELWVFASLNARASGDSVSLERLKSEFSRMLKAIATLPKDHRDSGMRAATMVAATLCDASSTDERLKYMASRLQEMLAIIPESSDTVRRIASHYVRRVEANLTANFANVLLLGRLY